MSNSKSAKPKKPGSLVIEASTKDEADKKTARVMTHGAFNAVVVKAYGNVEGMPDLSVLYEHILGNTRSLKADEGDRLHCAEGMLLSQATALQSMFVDLAVRAKHQKDREWLQALTSLALRAQSNCTQTLRVLAELRNPRQPVFAKQANIAHGPQQVNNGASVNRTNTHARVRAQDRTAMPNELLENQHGHHLDTGTARASGTADQAMEAVGTINRSTQ